MSAQAQELSLTVNPPKLEVVIKPGKIVVLTYNVQNNGDPTPLVVKVTSFEASNEKGGIRIKDSLEGPVRFQLNNADIALNQPFFLRNKDTKQIVLSVRLPENAPEGDYYYIVLFETQPQPDSLSETAPQSKATIGSPLLITVTETGIIDVKGKINVFDVISPITFRLGQKQYHIFDSSDRIPVSLVLANTGNNLIQPQGQITLRGNFGERATFNINPQNILSQSQRLLSATPSATLTCEEKPEKLCNSPLSLIIPGFFIGSYQLSTAIQFGEGTPTVFASTSFIAVPFRFFIILIFLIGISFIIIKKIASEKPEEE